MQKKTTIISSISVVLVLALGGLFLLNRKSSTMASNIITVERRDMIQEITVTGQVKTMHDATLAFETGGKVAKEYVDVGATVVAGQVIATLTNADQRASLAQGEARLASARASKEQYTAALENQRAQLDELMRGARPEEVRVAETKAINAEQVLTDAKTNLINIQEKANLDSQHLLDSVRDVLNDAYLNADDALHKQLDDQFIDDDTYFPRLSFFTTDSQAKSDAEDQRIISGIKLHAMKSSIDALDTNGEHRITALHDARENLAPISNFLARMSDVLNGTSAVLASATVSAYKTNLSTARTNINASITAIVNHEQAIANQRRTNDNTVATAKTTVNNATSALQSARDELVLKSAPPTTEKIQAQQAQIHQAEANIKSQDAMILEAEANVRAAQAQLAKTVLVAPLNGVVTKNDAQAGEIIAPNQALFTIIAMNALEIETNIPEVDIGRVNIGNAVHISLDAFPGETFTGKITFIDPAETTIDGVVHFKAKIGVDTTSAQLKSGLTANLRIETLRKSSVLALPQYALLEKDSGVFVKKQDNGVTQETRVKLGIRGSDGYVEILSGVDEGNQVINVGLK